MSGNKKIFVISDLHMGDGGPRDNFAVGQRKDEFIGFLDYVKQNDGELLILGDLFEFWQASLGSVLVKRLPYIDKLANMDFKFVVGNHDADLKALIGSSILGHQFFDQMRPSFDRVIGGKKFMFMHGHEVDVFNKDDNPGWGRILAIFAGIFEDRNGSPMLSEGVTVEEVLNGFGENMLRFWNWLVNKMKKGLKKGDSTSPKKELTPSQNPERAEEMLKLYKKDKTEKGYDIAIVGHTHKAGKYENWYFNSGSWVGENNEFLAISPEGEINFHHWKNNTDISIDTPVIKP